MKNRKLLLIWALLSLGLLIYFSSLLLQDSQAKLIFSPGKMTGGHYQIEASCTSCHTQGFKGHQALEESCIRCHAKELKHFEDKHPFSKFKDPRNADRLEQIDALKCISCHSEHKADETHEMGVTQPNDLCFRCHKDIAKDRISHKGMGFDTCSSTGCHNYHDNRSLYEDFLLKHADDNDTKSQAEISTFSLQSYLSLSKAEALNESDADHKADAKLMQDWTHSSHLARGVNCNACHTSKQNPEFNEHPDAKYCVSCHDNEVKGFLDSKHGMRIKAGLSPMRPSMARAQMHKEASHKELSCTSCHSFETQDAQVDACMQCHNDKHTNAYKSSKHYKLYQKVQRQEIPISQAVTCASCHMPKKVLQKEGKDFYYSEHNQNLNLRPNEKMIRSVCLECHGLGFSLDALADKGLIKNNFSSAPIHKIESIKLALERDKKHIKKEEK